MINLKVTNRGIVCPILMGMYSVQVLLLGIFQLLEEVCNWVGGCKVCFEGYSGI